MSQEGHPFDEYVGAKVITLATLLRRSTAIRYQRMFGMTMVESRVIIRVGVSSPLSLDQLAAHIAISKSQTSRVVTELVDRGLVQRERDTRQQRGVSITLTEEGKIVHRALLEAAGLRNGELTFGVDQARLTETAKVLETLIEKARALLVRDQDRPGRSSDEAEDIYEEL